MVLKTRFSPSGRLCVVVGGNWSHSTEESVAGSAPSGGTVHPQQGVRQVLLLDVSSSELSTGGLSENCREDSTSGPPAQQSPNHASLVAGCGGEWSRTS
jgi:hypothetical protein